MKHLFLLFLFSIFFSGCFVQFPGVYKEQSNNLTHNVQLSKKIYIDDSFSTKEKFLIRQVLGNWEIATNGMLKLEYAGEFDFSKEPLEAHFNKAILKKTYSNHPFINYIKMQILQEIMSEIKVVEEPEETEYIEYSKEGELITLYGYYLNKHSIEHILIVEDEMYVKGKLNENLFQHVVIHEIGHALNLAHDNNGPAVMNTSDFHKMIEKVENSNIHYPVMPTLYDVKQVCSVYGCNSLKPE